MPVVEGSSYARINDIPFDKLIAVHATRYLPQRESDGSLAVQSSFDGNGGLQKPITPDTWSKAKRSLRNTVHFSLNHVVEGHELGNWADAAYVVVSPLQAMIQQNGPPDVLNTVDTFWATKPDQAIHFSDFRLVRPDTSPDPEKLISRQGNEVLYTTNLRQDHVEALTALLGDKQCLKDFASGDASAVPQILAQLRDHAVEMVMKEDYGASLCPGGKWSWGDSWRTTEETSQLAETLGTKTMAHTESPWDQVEKALQSGKGEDAQNYAAKAGPRTEAYVHAVLASPQYEPLTAFIRANECAKNLLFGDGTHTKDFDGLWVDTLVRARTPEAVRTFQTVMQSIPSDNPAWQTALGDLIQRQEQSLIDRLDTQGPTAQISSNQLASLARPLAMMRQQYAHQDVTVPESALTLSVGPTQTIAFTEDGAVSVRDQDGLVFTGQGAAPLVNMRFCPPDPDEEPSDVPLLPPPLPSSVSKHGRNCGALLSAPQSKPPTGLKAPAGPKTKGFGL